MENLRNNRIAWLDAAKGLMIILVVSGHLLQTYENDLNFVFTVIYSFHMPVFFMLSGYLLNTKKNFAKFVKSKAKSLLLPYLLFCVILFVFDYLKYTLNDTSDIYIFDFKKNILNTILITHNSFFYKLWFLPSLFISLIIVYLVIKYINNHYIALGFVGIMSITIAIIYSKTDLNIPLCIDNGIFASFWVYCGYLHKMLNDKHKEVKPISFVIISFIILIMLNYINVKYLNTTNVNDSFRNITFINPVMFYITSAIGYIFTIGLSKLLSKSKLLILYGRNSLYIYGFHFMLLPFAHILIDKMPSNLFFQIISLVLFSLIIPLIISTFMILYGKSKQKLKGAKNENCSDSTNET